MCLAALAAWLKYSSFGRRIRATVQNRDLAETSGIRTRNIDRITFFVGSGLAGVAGVAASLIGGTNSQMGTQYIIPAFLVVVAGGVGQIKGTVIAAWALGHRAVVLRRLDDRKHGASARLRAPGGVPAVPSTGPVHGPHPGVDMTKLKPWLPLIGIAVFAVLLLVVAPAVLSMHWINNLGKYCCWAIAAVGIGLAWGRGGMLVLGQGVFFGLGAYAMAMHLTLGEHGTRQPSRLHDPVRPVGVASRLLGAVPQRRCSRWRPSCCSR